MDEAETAREAADAEAIEGCPHPPNAPERGAWLLGWVLAKACGAMLVRVETRDATAAIPVAPAPQPCTPCAERRADALDCDARHIQFGSAGATNDEKPGHLATRRD